MLPLPATTAVAATGSRPVPIAESYIEGARISGPTTGHHADHLPRGVIRGRIGTKEDRKYHVAAVIHDRNELGCRQARIRIVRILGERCRPPSPGPAIAWFPWGGQ